MSDHLDSIPENDPLRHPEQKKVIDRILAVNRDRPGATMVVLNELQKQIGFVSEAMQDHVAKELKVPVSSVHGVVSFYSFFTTTPRGRHVVKFCMGTACYVGGTPQLIEKAKQLLGIDIGQTTKDGGITLEVCRCVGACSQAPVMAIDDEVVGRVRPNKLPQSIRSLQD
ncbi:MAG TPA: NAD(P)H-dependent oxidoreductase subunit E [Longilinea sp.]|nr:NAD(P)H-dependent oxidoreductase subunit E [Longilinea sp.]